MARRPCFSSAVFSLNTAAGSGFDARPARKTQMMEQKRRSGQLTARFLTRANERVERGTCLRDAVARLTCMTTCVHMVHQGNGNGIIMRPSDSACGGRHVEHRYTIR